MGRTGRQEAAPLTDQTYQPQEPGVVALPPLPDYAPAVAPAAPKDRRVLRAVLRWTAAVVVFAAVGAGVTYGVTEQKRGDLPGLATESDGRWPYPRIEKPPLPKGAPAPFAEGNAREEHFADLRKLVLPAPQGAKEDKELAGKDGWLSTSAYLSEYGKEKRRDLAQTLKDGGLRHIAARGWTMPDGTRTRVYLLRFTTGAFTRDYRAQLDTNLAIPRGVEKFDQDFNTFQGGGKAVRYTTLFAYAEQKPYGKERVRYAYIEAGDVLALVVQSDDGHGPTIPFRQTVALQNQLLG
ncbi:MULTISPECIES: hypothetical protein [unclassified Streptomyces]|uniref:hypothetical protein n=1 Tax=unclassified Streptomyces TaxID=2593676 RepID=UPI00035E40AB|nr:hypothetical protein [Streptomyces sp. HmicA12]